MTSERLSFTIEPTIEHTQQLLDDYVSKGEVGGPLVDQLTNTIKQVKHHKDKGHIKEANNHLNKFLKHINNEPMQKHIHEKAKEVLIHDIEILIELFKGE